MAALKVNNSTVRIWTKAELKVTLAQSKANGFIVAKNAAYPGNTVVTNPENNDTVLSAMPGPNGMMLIRIDQSYFEK